MNRLPDSDEYRAIYLTLWRWCERHELRPHLTVWRGGNDNSWRPEAA